MKHIKSISIPEPCSQSWQQMTPVDGGRHCENCCKTVVDFTAMADVEIISYFAIKNNVCGRFNEPQLTGVNLQLDRQVTKSESGWKKWVTTAALLGSTVFYKVHGQTTPVNANVDQSPSGSYQASVTKGKSGAVKGSEREIKGRIIDDMCMPLGGATVRVVGSNMALSTDTNGRFKFHAPIAAKLFTVSFVGFETETVAIDSLQNGVHEVKLTPQVISMNSLVVISGYPAKRYTSITGGAFVVVTKRHCWLWRMYYKYIRTPIHNIFY